MGKTGPKRAQYYYVEADTMEMERRRDGKAREKSKAEDVGEGIMAIRHPTNLTVVLYLSTSYIRRYSLEVGLI